MKFTKKIINSLSLGNKESDQTDSIIRRINESKDKLIEIVYSGRVYIDDGHRSIGSQHVDNSILYFYDDQQRLSKITHTTHHQRGWDVEKYTSEYVFAYDQRGHIVKGGDLLSNFQIFNLDVADKKIKMYVFGFTSITHFHEVADDIVINFSVLKTSNNDFTLLATVPRKITRFPPTGEETIEYFTLATFKFKC
jgi:hypothetical protein